MREFIKQARRKDATSVKYIKVKKNGKDVTKFKLRTSRYLYTFTMGAKDKVEKVMMSMPPNIKKIDLDANKTN